MATARAPQPHAPGPPEERRRSWRSNFVAESWAELKKVEWPGQNQVIQGTVVVLIACAVVGIYLYLNDQLWKEVVSRLLLGQ
jgi:preprotein translocase subunit SecE